MQNSDSSEIRVKQVVLGLVTIGINEQDEIAAPYYLKTFISQMGCVSSVYFAAFPYFRKIPRLLKDTAYVEMMAKHGKIRI